MYELISLEHVLQENEYRCPYCRCIFKVDPNKDADKIERKEWCDEYGLQWQDTVKCPNCGAAVIISEGGR